MTTPLKQRCIEPGRWIINGRRVTAVYQGRSRNTLCWNIHKLPGEDPPNPFWHLAEARDWIRKQAV